MTERIFLSYAQEDRALAIDIKQKLREHGIISEEAVDIVDPYTTLTTGDDFRQKIRMQMNGADRVVIIASDSSIQSDWVNYEAGMAFALDKPVVIVAKTKAAERLFRDTFDNARLITLHQ